MPITTSAKKALRQSKRRRTENVRHMNKIRIVVKEISKLSLEKKGTEARALLARLYRVLDQAVKKNILKKNTVSRKKSRITKAVAKVAKK